MKLINYPLDFNLNNCFDSSNEETNLLLYAVIIHRVCFFVLYCMKREYQLNLGIITVLPGKILMKILNDLCSMIHKLLQLEKVRLLVN